MATATAPRPTQTPSSIKAPRPTFQVQRKHYKRTYELESIEQLTDDTARVVGRPVFKSGTRGRPKTIGHLVLDSAA